VKILNWLGILFTVLWSSAAIATKIGLRSAAPLTLATIRFYLAGILLFLYVYAFRKNYVWPKRIQWLHLVVLGFLNTTLYLGASFWALNTVSAGLFNLFVTVNPFVVALLSSIWLKQRVTPREWIGMLISAVGLFVATYPSMKHSYATMSGLILLGIGMCSMAIGSIYFKKVQLDLPGTVINTWQVMFGALLLTPIVLIVERGTTVKVDANLIGSLVWLVVAVSISAMLLWFYLLKLDAVKANNLLFLTPIFGYGLSAIVLNEAITIYSVIGTVIVLSGFLLAGNINLPDEKR